MAQANSQQAAKTPSAPTPPAPKPSGNAASDTKGGVGTAVPMKMMEGVTAENFTTYTKAQLENGFGNTSNAIRGLHALGIKAGPIAKQLGIRYQHARNVIKRPLKREIAAAKANGGSASAVSADKK